MTLQSDRAVWFSQTFDRIVTNVEQAVVGKTEVVRLAVTTLLSEGHLLLEDFPGTGKTSLARAIAQTVEGSTSRIQFTPDLLPADVTGVTIYDQKTQQFEFHRGPIFASVVVADEINRASPKTQSALLEVMEEGHVTVDGVTHEVGRPFMVMATQNPIEQAGTYRLPEAQLDRFLMKTSLGYPDHESTLQILKAEPQRRGGIELNPVLTSATVVEMTELAASNHVDDAIVDYISQIATQTRIAPEVTLGCSVRACLALVRAAKTWAAAAGRHYVLPEDVQRLAIPVLAHRMLLDPEEEFRGTTTAEVLERILREVPVPVERVQG